MCAWEVVFASVAEGGYSAGVVAVFAMDTTVCGEWMAAVMTDGDKIGRKCLTAVGTIGSHGGILRGGELRVPQRVQVYWMVVWRVG